ncbi:MAG: formylglycine-generating enzyme family protein [Pontibacterium sp.]
MVWKRVALAVTPESEREAYANTLGLNKQEATHQVRDIPLHDLNGDSDDKGVELGSKTPNELSPQVSSPKIPPLVLPYVVSNEQVLEPPKPTKLIKTAGSLPKPEGHESYQFPISPFLAERKQWLPLIYKHLAQQEVRKSVDINALCDGIAKQKTLHKVPKNIRDYWPARLDILVDNTNEQQPYWRDYYQIAEYLRDLLGAERVNIMRSIEFGASDDGLTHSTPLIGESHSACLLLSHRKVNDLSYALYRRYNNAKQRIQLNPALSPQDSIQNSAQSPTQNANSKTATSNDDKCLAWPISSQAQPVAIAKNLPYAGLELALTTLAPITVLDKHLLRHLRLALGWGGAALEAQIWNHEHIEDRGLGHGLKLDADIRAKYEGQYKQLLHDSPDYIQQLESLVNAHLANTYNGLKHLQTCSFDVLAGRPTQDSAAWQYVSKMCSDANEQGNALRGQCNTYVSLMPDSVYTQTEYDNAIYNLVHHANPDELPTNMPEGFDPNKLPDERKSKVSSVMQTWVVSQSRSGEISLAPREEGSPSFSASFTDPTPSIQTGTAYKTHRLAELTAFECEPIRLSHIQSNTSNLRYFSESEADKTLFTPNAQTLISEAGQHTITPEQPIQLRTHKQTVTLGAIKRPAWASEFGCNQKGELYAHMPHKGDHLIVLFNPSAGKWQYPAPFGEDLHGLYQDVDIAGFTQCFRWIPPGEFMMGSPEDEPERSDNETQHKVVISQGYWLADTTVTQAQWQQISQNNSSEFAGEDLPVNNVSWLDAIAFIQALNQKQPYQFLLPSEAQWEYASRAGTNTPFSTGENITTAQANYDGGFPYDDFPKGEYRNKTVPAKSFAPNPWGLYQMHGNVWEWCLDEHEANLAEPDQVRQDPVMGKVSDDNSTFRVLRGGSWSSYGYFCRSAFRRLAPSGNRRSDFGLRLSLGHELQAGGASAQALRSDD